MKYDFYITGTIGEEFDWWTGQRGTTAAQVRHYLDNNKDRELTIAVSSQGGYLDEGIAIAELIKAHGKCHMVIIGMTASAATVLCMKAKSVRIARGSLMLIHNCSTYIYSGGQSNKHRLDSYIEELKKTREDLDTIDKAIADIYGSRNGKTIDENLALMDEEKWLTAQEAVDFGLADEILDDENTATQTKAIQNAYASMEGVEEHYSLPKLPKFEQAAAKVPRGIMARLRDFVNFFNSETADTTATTTDNNINQNPNPTNQMKKLVLNIICAVLAIEDFAVGEEDKVTLTTAQLQSVEDAMKADRDKISALETAKADAEKKLADAVKAQADAEQKLAELRKEFDDFKAEAGSTTSGKPAEGSKPEPLNSAGMYNDIKSLL